VTFLPPPPNLRARVNQHTSGFFFKIKNNNIGIKKKVVIFPQKIAQQKIQTYTRKTHSSPKIPKLFVEKWATAETREWSNTSRGSKTKYLVGCGGVGGDAS